MTIFIVWIGVRPYFILDQLIIPQLNSMAYSRYFIENYIESIQLFKAYDVLMALGIIMSGCVLFFAAKKYKWFDYQLPRWANIETIVFYPALLLMKNICRLLYGDRCPYNEAEFSKLREKDVNKSGLIDRFVVTVNVINRRYERSFIRLDAWIYLIILTMVFLFVFLRVWL
jgi:hypothetical protein